jgi:hypothetical protein
MDNDRVNRWLSLGANVGVLVGIVLILIELNQNSDLMRAQISQSRADNLIESMEARMHSDYWPAVSAKLRVDGQMQADRIASLSPEEKERVVYYYLREVNDVRNQFLQRQAGYLPETLWETSSRSQVVRLMSVAAALGRSCNRDKEFQEELNRIAREEGSPQCTGKNIC